jgi:hypothetical protein
LIVPARSPSVPVAGEMAGFNEGFVGFADILPVADGPEPEPEVPVAAVPALSFEGGGSTPLPAQSAAGQFLEKIHQFRDWMGHEFGTSGIFILDCDGGLIFDDGPHQHLHFLARGLALAIRRPGARRGNVHVKIAAGVILEAIPVATADGGVVLGALVSAPLSAESVRKVVDAMTSMCLNDRHA